MSKCFYWSLYFSQPFAVVYPYSFWYCYVPSTLPVVSESIFMYYHLFVNRICASIKFNFYGRPMEQGRPLYFCPVVCFFSSPNITVTYWMFAILPYMVLVQIQNAGLKCTARGSLEMQDPKISKKMPSAHHRTTLSGYIFTTKARIDNRKNLLNSNTSSTCPHDMANFGPLTKPSLFVFALHHFWFILWLKIAILCPTYMQRLK